MTDDNELMKEALKEAAQSRDSGDWAIGCVITLNGKIIIRGHNQVYSAKNRLLHAEMDAIMQLQKEHFQNRGKDFVLYTTFEPCPMCFGAILFGGIRKVVAGANFDNSGATAYLQHLPEFFKQPAYKTTVKTGVLAKQCAEMWISGEPAQKYIASGYVLPVKLEEMRDDYIKTYITPTVKAVD